MSPPATATITVAHREPELSQVRGLFVEYAAALRINLCFENFDAELASLPGDYASPGGALYLALAGDRPVGCAALRPLPGNEAELKRVYVRPEARGIGLGRRLVEEAIATATALGYTMLRLDTLPSMHEARVLYASLGFRETPRYNDHPVEGATFMALEL